MGIKEVFTMRSKYLQRLGGLIFATLMLVGIVFVAPTTVDAQTQTRQRRVIIVRPYRHWIHRPWGWGYDPWSPYGSAYRQYVFDNSEEAVNQGYKDGHKTGKSDGKKEKSYDPQRSHYYKDSGFGNFAEVYRSGFSRGYQDGYRVGASQAG
jgi:hypothetical protein